MSGPRHLNIEITSDTVCPYCYLGYKRLTAAISQAKAKSLPVTFSLRFLPFQLDSTLPSAPGVDKYERYLSKLGSKTRLEGMQKVLWNAGKEVGIDFKFGGRISNTLNSHRILEKAWEKGGEEAHRKVAEAFFELYFEEEGDIGDKEALAKKVGKTGVMSEEEVLKFIESDELEEEVKEGFDEARQKGISGVPYTIINNKFALSGAQDSETFLQAFEQIANGELK